MQRPEFDAGLSREAAERGAAVDLASQRRCFLHAVLASWRAEIEPSACLASVKALKETSLLFLAGPHALQAVQNAGRALPVRRFDGNAEALAIGSVHVACCPALAWSSLQLKPTA